MGDDAVVLQVPGPGGAVRDVRLTSPDRQYFDEAALTKLDVAEYYLSVPAGITRALAERPCMLHRFPRGTSGQKVHQKKLPAGAPDWVETVDVFFPRYSRTVQELCVTEAASVIWAVQMATVEFHPWNSRRGHIEHPDEWRIDLDPMPDADFARVRRVAHAVHEVLDELGIVGYPKTSGGHGLHVYVRIEPEWEFADVRRAALAFGSEVVRRLPDDATVQWWRKDRDPASVFIDFNQNARDHTMAAAYSIRANARATVSAPLRWEEIDTAEPDDFTVATMPGRYAELGDLHAGIDSERFRLDELLEWADRDEKV